VSPFRIGTLSSAQDDLIHGKIRRLPTDVDTASGIDLGDVKMFRHDEFLLSVIFCFGVLGIHHTHIIYIRYLKKSIFHLGAKYPAAQAVVQPEL
jgi:hypothetical protein